MKEKLIKTTYELIAVSPLHIGSGETLRQYEYIYDENNLTAYFIDEAKWIKLLDRYKLMDKFGDYMMNTARAMTGKNNFKVKYLWDWLKSNGVPANEIKTLARRKAKATAETMRGNKKSLNDIAMQISLADGSPYIPGSSIKGALRAGILYRLIKNNPNLKSKYWNEIEKVKLYGDFKKKLTQISANLEKELLSRLKNPEAEKKQKRLDAQTQSVMRGLTVSDAMPTSKQSTVIVKKIDASTKQDKSGSKIKNLPLSRECIAPNAKFRFSITVDKSMLKEIGFENAGEIIESAHEFFLAGLEMQEKIFGRDFKAEFDEAKTADFAIGGGTGFLTKTLCYALAPSEHEGKEFVKKFLDVTFNKHKHSVLDNKLSPRTLKLAKLPGERFIMGLAQINEVK